VTARRRLKSVEVEVAYWYDVHLAVDAVSLLPVTVYSVLLTRVRVASAQVVRYDDGTRGGSDARLVAHLGASASVQYAQ
jgi:hypothetical protein